MHILTCTSTTLTLLLSLLSTPIPTHANVAPSLNLNPPGSTLEGSCGKYTAWPTEEAYLWGIGAFCDTFVNTTAKHLISATNSLLCTYDLMNGNGQRGSWVFEIICQYPNSKPANMVALCQMTNEMCKERFGRFLDNPGMVRDGGGLGKSYCVKEGTGGDALNGKMGRAGMSGEGEVVVWGGLIDEASIRPQGMSTTARPIFKARRKGEHNQPT